MENILNISNMPFMKVMQQMQNSISYGDTQQKQFLWNCILENGPLFPLMEEYDPSLKWKMLMALQRSYGPQQIKFINNKVQLNNVELVTLVDLTKALDLKPDIDQIDIKGFLMEIPILKQLSSIAQSTLISMIISLVAHIYALVQAKDDPIMWAIQLAGIAAIIVTCILHFTDTKEIEDLISWDFIPGKKDIRANLEQEVMTALNFIVSDKFKPQVDVHACMLNKFPIFFEGKINGPEWKNFLTNHIEPCFGDLYYIHFMNGNVEVIGDAGYLGCVVEGTDGWYWHSVPDQDQMDIGTLMESPLFTKLIGLVYSGVLAVISQTGLMTVKDFLDFDRVKSAIMRDTKEIKGIIEFITEDVLHICKSVHVKQIEVLRDQHQINLDLSEKPINWFCENMERPYFIKQAITQSVNHLSLLKTTQDSRTSLLEMAKLLQASVTTLTQKSKDVQDRLRTMDHRPDVVVIHLYGLAGIGKTRFCKYLINELAQRLGIPSAVYSINLPNNEHWPLYAGQQIAVYDEFGRNRSDDPITKHLNGLCSSGYFSMDGADLSSKPQPCGIRILILISNQPRWNLGKVLTAEATTAFWSRMRTYRVHWDGYSPNQRLTKIGRKPDFSHLDFYEETFQDKDNCFAPLTSKLVGKGTIIHNAMVLYQAHQAEFLATPRLYENDHDQSANSHPLVFNLSGPCGVGKTTYVKTIVVPTLKTFTSLPDYWISSWDQLEAKTHKSIYILDDLLVSSISADRLAQYTSFYNCAAPGSIIIVISNIKFKQCHALGFTNRIPHIYRYTLLEKEFYNNDACIRRLGLEGWIKNNNQWYYEGFQGTEIIMQQERIMVSGKPITYAEFLKSIVTTYQKHITGTEIMDVSLVPHNEIQYVEDPNCIQIRNITLEDLSTMVKEGGIAILRAIKAKQLIIPQEIFNQFDTSFPVKDFIFSVEPAQLSLQISKLMIKLRKVCSFANVYIDCDKYKLRTDGNKVFYSIAAKDERIVTFSMQPHNTPILDQYLEIVTKCSDRALIDMIPSSDVFQWIMGDVTKLPLDHMNCNDHRRIKEFFITTPTYKAMYADYLKAKHTLEIEKYKAQITMKLTNFLSSNIVIKGFVVFCVATGGLISFMIVRKLFSDKNQGKKGGAKMIPINKYATGGYSSNEPDPTDFPKQKGQVITHVSKETSEFIDWEKYDAAYALWNGKNQMFTLPLNENLPAVDQVIKYLHKNACRLHSASGSLVGHMLFENVGLSNAHFILYSFIAREDKSVPFHLWIDTYEFDVEKDGKMYKAQCVRFCPKIDQMLFRITGHIDSCTDIRSLFLTNEKLYPTSTYTGALIKYRPNPLIEKCNMDFAVNSPPYVSACGTAVMHHGISARFMTSEQGIATKAGDCGSFYILTGDVPTQNQHARIIGMHVGLRRGEHPHATSISHEMLYGKELKECVNQSVLPVQEFMDKHYGLKGKEVLSSDVTSMISALEPPSPGLYEDSTIEVLGKNRNVYVKSLHPERFPTGYEDIVTEVFGHNSGMIPTSTSYGTKLYSDVLKVDGKYDVLATQFQPYGEKLGKIDDQLLDKITDHLQTRYTTIYNINKNLPPPTFDEAINGYPEHHPLYNKVNRLEMDSSAGYYFKTKYQIMKKKEFFTLKNDKWVLKDTPAAVELKERALAVYDYLTLGIAYQTITQVCLKGELRPVEKVQAGVIRTFDSTDASVVIAHRMMLMNAVASFRDPSSRERGAPQIGQNALLSFPEYAKRFKGKKLLQQDFKQYDRRLHPKIIQKAYYLALIVAGQSEEKARTISEAMTIQTCYSYKLVGNHFCRTHQGISSGMYFTSLGDSIANEILMYYSVLKDTQHTPGWVAINFDPIILGDDISIGVSPQVAKDPTIIPTMVKNYHELGVMVTSPDKQSDIKFENDHELAFCSRTIRPTRNGVIVCPLKQKTILALFEWVSPVTNEIVTRVNGKEVVWTTDHQVVDSINNALNEASLHTPSQFKKYLLVAKKIASRMREKGVKQSIIDGIDMRDHLTREIYTESIISGRNIQVSILNNSLYSINNLDQIQTNMSGHNDIVLVEEWCNHYKLNKPVALAHTLPIPTEGKESKYIMMLDWEGSPTKFVGQGPNKKTSKLNAYHQVVERYQITPLISPASLSEFCNLRVKDYGAIEIRCFRNSNYYVYISERKTLTSVAGINPELSRAIYEARSSFFKSVQSFPECIDVSITPNNDTIDTLMEATNVFDKAFEEALETKKILTEAEQDYADLVGNADVDQIQPTRSELEQLLKDPKYEYPSYTRADYTTEIKQKMENRPRFKGESSRVQPMSYKEVVMKKAFPIGGYRKTKVKSDIPYHTSDVDQMESAPQGAGMTMNSSPGSVPPPPIAVTPASGAVPEPTTEPTALVNLPEGIAELENINQPPDMLQFGGVDFTIMDLAYRQAVDHVADKAINQNVPRGTVLLIQSYDPTTLNPYIQTLAKLHNRFVGPLIYRVHTIGNPIFMGELAWAWIPDIRKWREGDIISDAEFQKYMWVTFSVRESWTKCFALADARRSLFYRSTDIAADDLIETRPGFAIVMYRAVVNPFQNPEAACYFNVASYLSQNFRFSDPKLANELIGTSPGSQQTEAVNSISNRTFGTIFSEYGLADSPLVYMCTDGEQYPVVGLNLEIPTTTGKWEQPAIPYLKDTPYITLSSGASLYRTSNHKHALVESDYINGIIPQFSTKNYQTGADHAGMVVIGQVPTQIYSGGNQTVSLGYCLAANNVPAIITRFSGSGIDIVTSTTDSLTISFVPKNGSPVTRMSNTLSLTCECNGSKFQVFFFTLGFQTTDDPIQVRNAVFNSGVVSAVMTPVFQYNLSGDEKILRFGTSSFPVYTGEFYAPTSGVTSIEKRLNNYFNTLTSGTNGFCQFSLFDSDRRQIVATIRYDNEIGFTIRGQHMFAQYNGRKIANLVFTDVRFGDRTIPTRETDTSTWLLRQGSALTSLSYMPAIEIPAVISHYDFGEVVPDIQRSSRRQMYTQRRDIENIKRTLINMKTGDVDQMAMFAMAAGAGAMQGIGQGISEWQNRKFMQGENQADRDLHWNTQILNDKRSREMQQGSFTQEQLMQGNQFGHDQRMAALKNQLERESYNENRNVDMRNRLQMAGAMAPISNTAASRGVTPTMNRNHSQQVSGATTDSSSA
jgi:tRNA A37 threonylcarbamoyladenosine biosynthesis protein TsaE